MAARKTPAIDVLVVDDHRVFAEALAIAIGQDRRFAVHVATNAEEALDATARVRPSVALIYLEVPGNAGFRTIRRIREARAGLQVVVVSGSEDDMLKARAVEAGAVGYLSKLSPVAEVSSAVRAAIDVVRLIDPDEQARLMRVLRHRRHQESTQRMRVNRLTRRQLEILQMVADGVSSKEIAGRLGMTIQTERTHVQNILMKLAVHSKAQAVALAIKHEKVSMSAVASPAEEAEG